MSNETNGLICAVIMDGTGGGREIGWDQIAAWKPGSGKLWIHLDFRDEGAIAWIRDNVADSQAAETLLADETRPRSVTTGDHLLVSLRGVNLNPGSDPEDMVSVRIWAGPDRIITTRHRRIMAVTDARALFAAGNGPKSIADFLVFIADGLVRYMGPTLDQLADVVDGLEGAVLNGDEDTAFKPSTSAQLRRALGQVRRQVIELPLPRAPTRGDDPPAR